jgi:fructokinase
MKLPDGKILCFGELLWDRLPSGSKPGGAPMNVALHLKRLGQSPWFASRVGDDEPGRELISFLKDNGLKTGLIQRGKTLPTSEVLVKVDRKGIPSYKICEPVAWDNIAWTKKMEERSRNAGVIIFGTLAARNEITRNTLLNLLNTKAFRILDINLRPPYDQQETVEQLISRCDFLKLNKDELKLVSSWLETSRFDTENQISALANHFGLSGVCVTCGEEGAILYTGNHFYRHSGYKVEVADTVGAGDAFLAALVHSFLLKKSPEESLAWACATGALVASKEGATPAYDVTDIVSLMNTDEHPG